MKNIFFTLCCFFLAFGPLAQAQDVHVKNAIQIEFSNANYTCLGNGKALVLIKPFGGLPQYDGGSTEYTVAINGSSYANPIVQTIEGVASFLVQEGDDWNILVSDFANTKPLLFSDSFKEYSSDCPENLIPVYPGDANFSGKVSANDLLNIGLKYGFNGPVREMQTNDWKKTFAEPWTQNTANGLNLAHLDCNGDGQINDLDKDALLQNYHQEHQLPIVSPETFPTTDEGFILKFDLPEGEIGPGDYVSIPILFGDDKDPLVNLYGLSFTINYNKELIMPGTVSLDISESWLGQEGNDLISIQKSIDPLGEIQFGMVRTNHVNRRGEGKVAVLSFVIDDDIMGFRKEELLFELSFDKVQAVSNDESQIPVEIKESSFEVVTAIQTLLKEELIQIFPNPASDYFTIQYDEINNIEHIQISHLAGQKIVEYSNFNSSSLQISVSDLPNGIYLVTFQTSEGVHTSKLRIQR